MVHVMRRTTLIVDFRQDRQLLAANKSLQTAAKAAVVLMMILDLQGVNLHLLNNLDLRLQGQEVKTKIIASESLHLKCVPCSYFKPTLNQILKLYISSYPGIKILFQTMSSRTFLMVVNLWDSLVCTKAVLHIFTIATIVISHIIIKHSSLASITTVTITWLIHLHNADVKASPV